jgi:cytidylate kinase
VVSALDAVAAPAFGVVEALVGALDRVRAIGGRRIEGRDAGTRIAPDAPLRYFLSASAEARGKRRSGQRSDANLSETQRAIVERDLRDSGHDRATEETPGLIVIHTDELSQPQVVARIMQDLVRA